MKATPSVAGSERALAITVLIAMVGGLTVALGDVSSLPAGVVIAGVVAFLGGVALFGAVTYRAARRTGSSFRSALRWSLRTAGRVLVALMP